MPGALPERAVGLLPVWLRLGDRSKETDARAATMADGGSERADGRIVKMEVDYSATVDQRLPECEKLAKVCRKEGRQGRLAGCWQASEGAESLRAACLGLCKACWVLGGPEGIRWVPHLNPILGGCSRGALVLLEPLLPSLGALHAFPSCKIGA